MLNGLAWPQAHIIGAAIAHYFSVLVPDPSDDMLFIPCIYMLLRGGFEIMRNTCGDLRFVGVSGGVFGCAVFLFMPKSIHIYIAPIVVLFFAGALAYMLCPNGLRIKEPLSRIARRLRKQPL